MSSPAISAPAAYGTLQSWNRGDNSSSLANGSAIALMGWVKTSDLFITQMRWQRSARSLAFYAGSPSANKEYYYSSLYSGNSNHGSSGYSFNDIAPKVNAVTGRERQRRKSLS